MYRFRWLVLVIGVLLLLSFAIFAQKTPGMLKDNGFTPKGSESDRGLIQMRDELGVSTYDAEPGLYGERARYDGQSPSTSHYGFA